MNHYYLKARLFPTVLTAIPAIVFYNYFIAPLYNENLAGVFTTLPTITNTVFSAAIVFLLIQLNRFCAKEFFQKVYFNQDLKMPTTNHLLWKDLTFEESIKRKIRKKILEQFNIDLLSEEEEKAEELQARKIITTAISQVRICLQGNQMLFQHNIEYGFFRNLVGGSLLAVIFSSLILLLAFINSYSQLRVIAIVLIIIYLIPLALSKFFIKRYGEYYSKILYEQFLSHTPQQKQI